MLQLETKWMNNTIAKKSLQSGDYIVCANNLRLYIVGFGELTSSAKNTYNYELKDDKGIILASGNNAYLDKLTTLVKGENPKAKEKKENNSNNKNNDNMKAKKSSLVNEFMKLRDNLKKATLAFNDFQMKHNVTTLEDVEVLDATIAKNIEEIEALRKTLEIAKASNNETLIASIETMIQEKTK